VPLFEMEEGTSRKFYRIERVGTRVELHWGRIGTDGKRDVIEHATEREAEAEYDRQIAKRRERGYRQVFDETVPHDAEAARVEKMAAAAPLSDSPRFVFVNEKKKRFVWLEARGAVLVSAEGAVGEETATPPTEKAFDSPQAAIRARDRRTAELMGKGFELAEFATAPEPKPRKKVGALLENAALENQLRDDPTDEAAWTVFEDWLIESGDPRGEIVEHERARQPGDAAEARGRIAKLLFDSRPTAVPHAMSQVEWRAGFVRECWFTIPAREGPDIFKAFVGAPATRLLSSLRVTSQHDTYSLDAALARICESPIAAQLRELAITGLAWKKPITGATFAPLARLVFLSIDLSVDGAGEDEVARRAERILDGLLLPKLERLRLGGREHSIKK
jgi:uncharacterized protein (TIGR02996 family)